MAVLVTGDELVPVEARPSGGQIRNSNGPCLRALAAEAGCEVIDLGVVGDDRSLLAARVGDGLQADVLCITGGMSMGQHDYVPEVLAGFGVRTEVQKIAIKPGKPALFGVGSRDQIVFGLPGNPVSCLVCFLIVVRAALSAMQGRAAMPGMVAATVTAPLPATRGREEYLPARLEQTSRAAWSVTPVRWGGSGDPFGAAAANGLLVRDANAPAAEAGAMVPVVPLEW
jgi:molybdopterin molybdotransferase